MSKSHTAVGKASKKSAKLVLGTSPQLSFLNEAGNVKFDQSRDITAAPGIPDGFNIAEMLFVLSPPLRHAERANGRSLGFIRNPIRGPSRGIICPRSWRYSRPGSQTARSFNRCSARGDIRCPADSVP